MKKSEWLQNYENRTKELQNNSKSGKKVALIIIPILFLGMGVAIMASNNSPEIDMTPYLIGMGVIFVFIFLMALLLYRFARLRDVAKNDYTAMRGKEKVLGRMFLMDLLDAQGKKILGLTVEGTKRMSELEEALKRYCPGIQLKEHKLF